MGLKCAYLRPLHDAHKNQAYKVGPRAAMGPKPDKVSFWKPRQINFCFIWPKMILNFNFFYRLGCELSKCVEIYGQKVILGADWTPDPKHIR